MGQEAAKLMGPHICCTVTFDRCGLVKQTEKQKKTRRDVLSLNYIAYDIYQGTIIDHDYRTKTA